jgi:hypothetical protein
MNSTTRPGGVRRPRWRPAPIIVLTLAFLLLATAPAHAAFNSTAVWGEPGTGPSQFNNPRGLAVDAAGNVYVADQANHRIQKFGPGGAFIDEWGGNGTAEGQFGNPRGVAVGPGGEVYVADTNNSRVQQFTTSGDFVRMWGWGVDDGSAEFQICTSGCQAGSGGGDGAVPQPEDVVTDATGNVYVLAGQVVKFDSNANFLTDWPVNDPGESSLAAGVGTDPTGNVYVADVLQNNVQKFSPTGNLLDEITGLSAPFDASTDFAGNVYVADTGNNRIAQFDANGNFLGDFGSFGTGQGQFGSPIGVLATGCPVTVYVAELDNDRIQRFDESGNPGCPPPQAQPPGGGGSADTDPPETTITDGPKKKTSKKKARFEFTSDEPGSTFECSLDGTPFQPCSSPEEAKVKRGKHTFEVRATDASANTDPTPATQSWTVKKKKEKKK